MPHFIPTHAFYHIWYEIVVFGIVWLDNWCVLMIINYYYCLPPPQEITVDHINITVTTITILGL